MFPQFQVTLENQYIVASCVMDIMSGWCCDIVTILTILQYNKLQLTSNNPLIFTLDEYWYSPHFDLLKTILYVPCDTAGWSLKCVGLAPSWSTSWWKRGCTFQTTVRFFLNLPNACAASLVSHISTATVGLCLCQAAIPSSVLTVNVHCPAKKKQKTTAWVAVMVSVTWW